MCPSVEQIHLPEGTFQGVYQWEGSLRGVQLGGGTVVLGMSEGVKQLSAQVTVLALCSDAPACTLFCALRILPTAQPKSAECWFKWWCHQSMLSIVNSDWGGG